MLPALIAMLSLVAPPAAVSAPPGAPAPDLPQIAFEKYTLANGLEVILHEDHRMSNPLFVIRPARACSAWSGLCNAS